MLLKIASICVNSDGPMGWSVCSASLLMSVSPHDTKPLRTVSIRDTYSLVIRNFKNDLARAAFEGEATKGFPADLLKVARRKLQYLNAAISLQDLRSPPGNRLEALKGDRDGQHSIRVNDQFRICFVWTKNGPTDVEFTDYH